MTYVFTVTIKNIEGETHTIDFPTGKLTFVLGANGSGKSTLLGKISKANKNKTRRLDAHRNITLESSAVSITGANRSSMKGQFEYQLQHESMRYKNSYNKSFVDSYIYDLQESERAFKAEQLDTLKLTEAGSLAAATALKKAQQAPSPLDRIGSILNAGGLNLNITYNATGELEVRRGDHPPYGINELSDGERAAFLLASAVITAPKGYLIIIDEPERHLHRAISSPLIHALLNERPDCSFVISTHDIGLPIDQPSCSAVLIRRYQHTPCAWEWNHVAKIESLDVQIAEAILGSRKRILFVEGKRESLDLHLYSRLFPNISVKSQESCSQVIHVTKGVNASSSNHWVEAFGLIDRDRMSDEAVARFEEDNLFALSVHSVESLYYHPTTVLLVGEMLDKTGTIDASNLNAELEGIILKQMALMKNYLVRDATIRSVREHVTANLPVTSDLMEQPFPNAGLSEADVTEVYESESATFENMIAEKNATGLINSYKVKSTSIPTLIAKHLKYSDTSAYENTVRTMVANDIMAADEIRSLIGPLSAKLTST